MKKTIALDDFLDFTFLSDITYAPNSQYAAFIASTCNEQDNTYNRDLYIYDGTSIRQLTSDHKDSMFLWEDDQHILFASMRNERDVEAVKKGEEKTCFYRINIYGGEALPAFTIPLQVTSIKKMNASTYAFCADYHASYSCMYLLDEEQKKNLQNEKESMKDYELFDEMPFYMNGAGITNQHRSTLFLYYCDTNEIKRVSEEFFSVSDYEWSEDDSSLYYVGEQYTAKAKNKEGIMEYNIKEETTRQLLKADVYSIYKILPYQNTLLVVASDQATYGLNENSKFYKYDQKTQDLVVFANYEEAIGSSVGSDCRYGGGRNIKRYGEHVYFLTTLYNHSAIYQLDKTGTITSMYDTEGSVDDFDVFEGRIVFIGLQDMRLQELYQYDINTKQRTQQSMFHDEYYKAKDIRPCVPCTIEQDGMTLYGWVLEPSGYDSTKSYPAILDIHGGPKTVYGEVYYHEMQVWANMGYFVFFMNPRGGDGRGNTFMDIRGKYGTIDYDDLMKFTDVVCARYPSIDSSKLGVTGGSYGGFMTNWMIGHTNRFKVAASQRSIANWISFANTSDIGDYFTQDQQAGNIYDDFDALWERSPLKYARNVTTPTLFIHADEDYRCPISEGLQMYSALLHQGVEARMCVFHGENHELSRSGKPKHRVKRLEEITNWMNKFLK